jgi:hypothetical protein
VQPRAIAIALVQLFGAATAIGCQEHGAIVIHLTSSLEIPLETDALLVHLYSGGASIRDQTYPLGTPPRDGWPQVLPIVSDGGELSSVTIAAELRKAGRGQIPMLVGYSAIDAVFPSSGARDVALDIARACDSPDGYGSGSGCRGPRPIADAGVMMMIRSDAGSVSAPPDAGGPAGGCAPIEGPCAANEVCFEDHCRTTCSEMNPCQDANYAYCVDPPGVCDCTLRCNDNTSRCYPFTCLANGCCRLQ